MMENDNLNHSNLQKAVHIHAVSQELQQILRVRAKSSSAVVSGLRTVDVFASGQASAAPDRCSFSIAVCSVKPDSEAARSSVERRLAYILKILHNNGLNTENEQEVLLLRELQRTEDNKYKYIALLRAEFNSHSSMQYVLNTFTEKLDAASVRISEPRFFTSASLREAIRQRATLTALANAKRKASDCCQFLGAQLGAAVRICEEHASETAGLRTDEETDYLNTIPIGDDNSRPPSAHLELEKTGDRGLERFEAAYTHSRVRLLATFEMQPTKRSLS